MVKKLLETKWFYVYNIYFEFQISTDLWDSVSQIAEHRLFTQKNTFYREKTQGPNLRDSVSQIRNATKTACNTAFILAR